MRQHQDTFKQWKPFCKDTISAITKSQRRSQGTPTKRYARATAPEEGEELRDCGVRPDVYFVLLSSTGRVLSVGDVGEPNGQRSKSEKAQY
ncbi:hypothetical protein CHS0354_029782 [Potamilus streckersoni]|uniref:Uncharacterized protein n=1 Tax=Potamilus streckersoni TaxID=2493646 RepID=A0AAE0THJ0_9BIVA|nr:hypothetical protein CHS0354_029782 [Potamilus streckersoni]